MICTIISNGEEHNIKYRNEHEKPFLTIKEKLRETIWQLYCEGYDEFYVNCENGIPLWSAEIIVALKLYNQITLNIIVPFEEQCLNWSEDKRDRYYTIHEKADTVEFVCTKYENGCYQTAVEIMIDKSNLVIIFGNSEKAESSAKSWNWTDNYYNNLKKKIVEFEEKKEGTI